ncbi:hypothetical protein PybrP1_005994 [[Pythium] brassicae (nom. inval.)]|nr:hypothetical protein PybrP1_005994 [[Pythium] brassicae (nom. inval.)]
MRAAASCRGEGGSQGFAVRHVREGVGEQRGSQEQAQLARAACVDRGVREDRRQWHPRNDLAAHPTHPDDEPDLRARGDCGHGGPAEQHGVGVSAAKAEGEPERVGPVEHVKPGLPRGRGQVLPTRAGSEELGRYRARQAVLECHEVGAAVTDEGSARPPASPIAAGELELLRGDLQPVGAAAGTRKPDRRERPSREGFQLVVREAECSADPPEQFEKRSGDGARAGAQHRIGRRDEGERGQGRRASAPNDGKPAGAGRSFTQRDGGWRRSVCSTVGRQRSAVVCLSACPAATTASAADATPTKLRLRPLPSSAAEWSDVGWICAPVRSVPAERERRSVCAAPARSLQRVCSIPAAGAVQQFLQPATTSSASISCTPPPPAATSAARRVRWLQPVPRIPAADV